VTLVMVTHDPVVAAAADRVVRLEAGRLQLATPPRELGLSRVQP
jgi:predicted ABC-type transport system involved in lysophospholipase L1 biosynthesis ATPase subunit